MACSVVDKFFHVLLILKLKTNKETSIGIDYTTSPNNLMVRSKIGSIFVKGEFLLSLLPFKHTKINYQNVLHLYI